MFSLPDYYESVERPSWVTVRYLDQHNQEHTLRAEGLLAVVIQHEIDHLNGKLFVDHVSSLKRNMILRKLTKSKKQGALSPEYVPLPDEKKA